MASSRESSARSQAIAVSLPPRWNASTRRCGRRAVPHSMTWPRSRRTFGPASSTRPSRSPSDAGSPNRRNGGREGREARATGQSRPGATAVPGRQRPPPGMEYLRAVILDLADAELVRVHWGEQVLAEVQRNLLKPKFGMTPASVDKLLRDMRNAFPDALVLGSEALEPEFEGKTDPKDARVAAGALKLSRPYGGQP